VERPGSCVDNPFYQNPYFILVSVFCPFYFSSPFSLNDDDDDDDGYSGYMKCRSVQFRRG
jgi:hypothetical protein